MSLTARTNDKQQSTSSSCNSAAQQRGCDGNIAAHIKAMTTASWCSGRALSTVVATQQAVFISSIEYWQEQQQAVGAGNRIE